MAKQTAKKVTKKRVKKNIDRGQAHIQSSFNNTIVTLTDMHFGYEKDANVSVGDSVTLEFYNNATEDALVVPSNAVFKAKSEHYVYRMDGDAKKKVKVTLGTKTDAYTQITSGLKEGDVVYVQD